MDRQPLWGRVLPILCWAIPNQLGIGAGAGNRYIQNSLYSAYGQDNWRIRRNLTLNLGLRWELNTPRAAKDGDEVNYGLFGGQIYHAELQQQRSG